MTLPRERVKALVEQLSAYPLGTMVRLMAGETGSIVGVNPRYPLRPIVKVDETGSEDGAASRQVDLSLTPLVGVIEALSSPDVGRATFAPERRAIDGGDSAQPGMGSDRFPALLESLDVIASAIQGAVETQEACAQEEPDQPIAEPVQGPLSQEGSTVFRVFSRTYPCTHRRNTRQVRSFLPLQSSLPNSSR